MTITVGLEEELQVVDAAGLGLAAHDVEAGRRALPDAGGSSTCEIHRCAIEVQSPVCRHVDDLVDALARLRRLASRRAWLQGQLVVAAGLHPFSDWRDQALHDDAGAYPRYARLVDEYVDVARGALSFGMHLHFGLPDARRRIDVMNRLRERLPCVLALSASAPFCGGRDTGMQSWRHALLDRYPRMGIPPAWPSEADYVAHLERLRRVGAVPPDQGMWEDIRLHHRYGTLEARICDATPSLDRVWLIAALLLCEVRTLDIEVGAGRARPVLCASLIAENRWRARRHGLGADFIDWHRDETLDGATHFRRWLARLAPAAEAFGLLPRLASGLEAALAEGTSADDQRAFVAGGGGMRALVGRLAEQTARPARAHGRVGA